jgi:PAS domain S-box-containing protein
MEGKAGVGMPPHAYSALDAAARCELLERALHALSDAITVCDRFGAVVFQNLAAQQPAAQVPNTDFITTLAKPLPAPLRDPASETSLDAWPADGVNIVVRSSMSWTNPLVRRILDGVPQIAWQNPAGSAAVDYHNKWWYDYTGQLPGASCGWGWEQALHPDDVERVSAMWMASVQTGETYGTEVRVRAADGSYHWFLTCATPLLNDAGVVARWLGTAIDITAQKTLQEVLEDERALLVTALDQLPVSVVIAEGSSGSFRFINKKTYDIFHST